jgi:hypothetical protein
MPRICEQLPDAPHVNVLFKIVSPKVKYPENKIPIRYIIDITLKAIFASILF